MTRVLSLRRKDPAFSVRQVAGRIGVQPSYLSKLERGDQPPPWQEKVVALARELGESPDVLVALAGKVYGDLQASPATGRSFSVS